MLCSRALLFLSVFSVAFCELYIVHGDGKVGGVAIPVQQNPVNIYIIL